MLQKEHRLTDKRDFQRVFHHGQSFANRYLVIYYLKNRNSSDAFRVGFSVSKKVGKAVVRNRVKRLLREAFRSSRDQIKGSYDLVVIARPSAAELEYDNVVQNVHHLLRNMDKPDAGKRKPSSPARRAGAPDKQGERKKGVN